MEPWHFVVVQSETLRDKLKPYSWGAQKQLDTASHFVLIFARKNVTSQSEYVQNLIRGVKQYEESIIPAVNEKFDNFQTNSTLMIMNVHCMIGLANKLILH